MSVRLSRFAASLPAAEAEATVALVREYAGWLAARQGQRRFAPNADDDIHIRDYLLHLRQAGAGRRKYAQHLAALKRFYAWAAAAGRIEDNPFDEYDFDRPFLSRADIRRRQDAHADPREREIVRLRALNRLADRLTHSIDLQATLDLTLEALVEIMGLQTAWIFLLTEAGLMRHLPLTPAPHDFALCAECGLPPALETDHQIYLRQPGDCHCQALLRRGRLTRAVNVVECTRLQEAEADAAGDTHGLLFHATVPLVVQGQPVGILNVATDEWQFLSAADLQLLSAVGAQASAAIERAQWFARSVDLGAAEERNRLAREIHDTLAQGLTAISLQLETADALLETGGTGRAREAVGQALALTRANLDEARRSVLDLRAAPLEGRTLGEALKALAADYAARWQHPVRFTLTGGERPLPLRVEAGLYRIAQEALSNVVRHAHARRASVKLTLTARQIRLTIGDDGRGFEPAAPPPGRFGLIGMSERARLLGGRLRIESRPGRGTRVDVNVPLRRSPQEADDSHSNPDHG